MIMFLHRKKWVKYPFLEFIVTENTVELNTILSSSQIWLTFYVQLCVPIAENMWLYWQTTRKVTSVVTYMTYQSSECSHWTSGEIIGVPLLTGYFTGGYKFANCGCKPSSYNLQQQEFATEDSNVEKFIQRFRNIYLFFSCFLEID